MGVFVHMFDLKKKLLFPFLMSPLHKFIRLVWIPLIKKFNVQIMKRALGNVFQKTSHVFD